MRAGNDNVKHVDIFTRPLKAASVGVAQKYTHIYVMYARAECQRRDNNNEKRER